MTITNQDIAHYAKLKAQAAALEEQINEYKAKFAEELDPGQAYETPDYSLTVRLGYYKPDAKAFTKKYSEARYPQFYKTTIDEVAVRKLLEEDKLSAVAKRISPSFIVKAKTKTK